jgi:hypothetical protein
MDANVEANAANMLSHMCRKLCMGTTMVPHNSVALWLHAGSYLPARQGIERMEAMDRATKKPAAATKIDRGHLANCR